MEEEQSTLNTTLTTKMSSLSIYIAWLGVVCDLAFVVGAALCFIACDKLLKEQTKPKCSDSNAQPIQTGADKGKCRCDTGETIDLTESCPERPDSSSKECADENAEPILQEGYELKCKCGNGETIDWSEHCPQGEIKPKPERPNPEQPGTNTGDAKDDSKLWLFISSNRWFLLTLLFCLIMLVVITVLIILRYRKQATALQVVAVSESEMGLYRVGNCEEFDFAVEKQD